jgi:nucleoside-diphosphate-sugar epimerase
MSRPHTGQHRQPSRPRLHLHRVVRLVFFLFHAFLADLSFSSPNSDWNTFSPKEVEDKGKDVDPSQAYRASKTLAERAAWKFIEEEKPSFDITTVNPPLIFGPIIHDVPSAEKLNTSVNKCVLSLPPFFLISLSRLDSGSFYQFLIGKKSDDDAQVGFGSLVDVRDVAQIHIDSLLNEKAGNERFLVATGSFRFSPFFLPSFPALELPSMRSPRASSEN